VPVLQLDIIGGTYDGSVDVETIITTDSSFDLVAYGLKDPNNGDQNDNGKTADTSMTYYISAAITPKQAQTTAGPDIGSFVFMGTTYDIDDLSYGTAPLDDALDGWDSGDLMKHGIFETYFMTFAFNFIDDADHTRTVVNTQDTTGTDPADYDDGDDLFFRTFDVDISNMAEGYGLHFDLYNTVVVNCKRNDNCDTEMDVGDFAPFSHDAETRTVPEPAPLALLGIGLLALVVTARRQHNRT
jgi:hypothetical protein